jgi:hypothetical protein
MHDFLVHSGGNVNFNHPSSMHANSLYDAQGIWKLLMMLKDLQGHLLM